MIVCTCTGITESEIRDAIDRDSMSELYEEGMMQQCGSCREDIKEIYDEYEKNVKIDKCK